MDGKSAVDLMDCSTEFQFFGSHMNGPGDAIYWAYTKGLGDAIAVIAKMVMPIDAHVGGARMGLIKSCIGTKLIGQFGNLIVDSAIDTTTAVGVDIGQVLRDDNFSNDFAFCTTAIDHPLHSRKVFRDGEHFQEAYAVAMIYLPRTPRYVKVYIHSTLHWLADWIFLKLGTVLHCESLKKILENMCEVGSVIIYMYANCGRLDLTVIELAQSILGANSNEFASNAKNLYVIVMLEVPLQIMVITCSSSSNMHMQTIIEQLEETNLGLVLSLLNSNTLNLDKKFEMSHGHEPNSAAAQLMPNRPQTVSIRVETAILHSKMIHRGSVLATTVCQSETYVDARLVLWFKLGLATTKEQVQQIQKCFLPIISYCDLWKEASLANGKDMLIVAYNLLAWKLGTMPLYVTSHPLIKGSLLISQHVELVVVLHRKMINRGNVLVTKIMLKWRDLPPKHGIWKFATDLDVFVAVHAISLVIAYKMLMYTTLSLFKNPTKDTLVTGEAILLKDRTLFGTAEGNSKSATAPRFLLASKGGKYVAVLHRKMIQKGKCSSC